MARIIAAGTIVAVLDIVYAWLLWGVVLGKLTMMQVMNRVVMPLSRAKAGPFLTWLTPVNVIQHVLMVGLPIALLVPPDPER